MSNTNTRERKYDNILTVEDLMDFLAVGRSTAYSLLRSGQIKCIKIGRVYKIPKENVLNYISTMDK